MPAATRAGGRAPSPSCPSGPKLHSRLAGEQPAWPPPPRPTGRPQRASLRPPRPSQVKPPPRARWSEARSLRGLVGRIAAALEQRSLPLADAHAQGCEPVATAAAPQLVQQRDNEAGAPHAQGGAEGGR